MSTSSEELALTYQEKTDIEHILDAPDTYIGSIESDNVKNWCLDENDNMKHKEYDFIGGLYKCFDEGIVNCRDHAVRLMQKIINKEKRIIPVRNIDISVDKETGVITMMNDGNGVDVAKHPDNDLWIPEMIFGHLRTSTNYNKDEKKIVGGKNGFGFKLVLIYSKWGEIETVDHIRKKKYTQRFENNLTNILEPVMAAFNLPAETALAVVLGSVRKDGLAIGLLNGEMDSLKVALNSPVQVLTSVYLAGVLLPCLVTVLTIGREMGLSFAIKMIGRQAFFAVIFGLCIAWFGLSLIHI